MFRSHRFFFVFTLLFLLGACGSEPPPPPPPPPANPNPGPQAGLGQFIEEQSPGQPLSEVQSDEPWIAMETNLDGLGFVTIQAESVLDYLVRLGYNGPTQFQHQPNSNPPPATGIRSYQISGSYNSIYFQADYGDSYSFQFVNRIRKYGMDLRSTDQVALFTTNSRNGYEVLKVLYRSPNPMMAWFTVQDITLGGGYDQYQLRVHSKTLQSNFQNRQR